MTKTQKAEAVEVLKGKFASTDFFYITDASTLTVAEVSKLRALCYEKGVEMKVVKNTLARKALEQSAAEKNYEGLYEALKGPTALLFTDTANAPAKLIKEFRKSHERPIVKAAYIDSSVYVGDDQLDALTKIKSKEELLGELVTLLQSPMQNLLGALDSGKTNLAGLLKALSEREEE
ncbi:MAG: 50S ribosomal protein L10 [Bacteroidota bacterium]